MGSKNRQPPPETAKPARARVNSEGPSRKRLAMVLGLAGATALTAGLLLWSSRREGTSLPGAKRRANLILITGDTLRPDKLGCYGNRIVATPHLDGLAASGVLFENATTVAPLTLPAHSSILTGTYPMFHGVRDNGSYLKEDRLTLAEVLKAQGYRTGAFVGAFVLDSRWGLNQGFERYFDDFDLSKFVKDRLDKAQRRGDEVLGEALRWLESAGQEPFFAWIHLYDPHTPYDPPEPFRSRYAVRLYGLYDGEVAYLDSLVGQLLEWLEERRLDESTVVAFVGDHGESLGQHGEGTHAFFIYDSTTQVPLILKAPQLRRFEGQRVSHQVRVVDLMPTVLELLNLPVPPSVQGQSLVGLATGEDDDLDLVAYGESYYPRFHYGWSELRSLRDGDLHFISAPRPELYDLRSDPLEMDNLAPQRSGAVQQLERRLAEMEARYAAGEEEEDSRPAHLDPESQQRLAALGYIGGAARVKVDPTRPLADPKDKIGLFNLITEAGLDTGEGRLDPAIEKLRRVLAEDPEVLEAYYTLGDLYRKKGQPSKAIEAFRQALARDPDYQPALFNLAMVYRDLGRLGDALVGLRRSRDLDPRDQGVLLILGQVAFELKRLDEAEEAFRSLLEINPRSAKAENNLGNVSLARGHLEEAKERFVRAADLDAGLANLHFNLGVVYQQLGDPARAEREYREEIRLHPEDLKAYHNLGLLMLESGNVDGQLEAFREVVKRDPGSARAHFLLADALFQKNRYREALPYVERAVVLDPSIREARLLLAAIREALRGRGAESPDGREPASKSPSSNQVGPGLAEAPRRPG